MVALAARAAPVSGLRSSGRLAKSCNCASPSTHVFALPLHQRRKLDAGSSAGFLFGCKNQSHQGCSHRPARKRRAGQAQAGQRGLRRQARQLGVVRDARAGRVQLRQRGQVRRQVRQRAQRVARKAQPAQAALACRAGLGFHCAGPPKRSAHERVALPAPHACLHAWRSGRFRYGLQLLIDMSMHGGFAHCVCQRGERWEAINRRLAQSGSFCGSVTASWRTSKGQGVEGLDGVAVQAQLLQRAARGQARHGGQPVARQVQPPQACHLGVQSDSAHAPYRPKEPSMCMHLEAERASRCREVGQVYMSGCPYIMPCLAARESCPERERACHAVQLQRGQACEAVVRQAQPRQRGQHRGGRAAGRWRALARQGRRGGRRAGDAERACAAQAVAGQAQVLQRGQRGQRAHLPAGRCLIMLRVVVGWATLVCMV